MLHKKAEKRYLEKEEIVNNAIYYNAFEWRFEFPEVLADDGSYIGFDVVIGNPPYIRIRNESQQVRTYYFNNYMVAENQLDLYHLFIEKSFEISNKQSLHAFITPNTFLANQNTAKLRQFILENFSIDNIIEIKDNVFEEASVDVLIFIFRRPRVQSVSHYYVAEKENFCFKNDFDSSAFNSTPNNNFTVTIDMERQSIISKILNKSVKVSDLFKTISGIKEYQVGKGKPSQNIEQVKAKVFNANSKINNTYLPELRGKNLSKYSFTWKNEHISYGVWLAEPRVPDFFNGDKILIRQIPAKNSLIASYVKETFVVDQTAYIAKPKTKINILFYLGVLNSTLLFWYFQNIHNEFDQLFPKIKVKEFNALPLPNVEFSNNDISDIVSKILNFKLSDKDFDISKYENQIDQLVYQLYDLTEEEIKIIEEVNA
ncbi:Eco57I restriction-modification methylase domain-containing protein [Gelidibacter gilvus]|uniref:Eco57I restriction-modification methylase domain-containing protein n=1 Tax=Gelidibacter gilvus TaxID=59602 RepID=UPI00167E82F5|nr:TaqI-like C-terminal specificity domain-containing protein [Gelidibacter gilvus]